MVFFNKLANNSDDSVGTYQLKYQTLMHDVRAVGGTHLLHLMAGTLLWLVSTSEACINAGRCRYHVQ